MSVGNKLKNVLFKIYLKFLNNEKVQQSLHHSIALAKQDLGNINNSKTPYKDIQNAKAELENTSERDDIIFITSRFRSGSTALWNIFRNIEGCTSYYEPFNERRWFDKNTRGAYVDSTHIGVDDYSKEYDGLEQLDQYYNEDWIRKGLFMDEKTWAPDMKSYLCELIDKANGRPVLQFNRIDFRLPWLKHNFPNAKFIHLYRHPRDQWLSFLKDKQLMNKDEVELTYKDAFYLDTWCKDLAKHFPFLAIEETPHPYQRFYYLWKLSFLYGQKYSDYSICYETLCAKPKEELNHTYQILGWDVSSIEKIVQVIQPAKLDKWKKYADEEWFIQLETACEYTLNQFFNRG